MIADSLPKLSPWHRYLVVLVALALALSGIAWMAGDIGLRIDPDRDGPEARSLLHSVLIAHGILGYGAAVLLGSLLGRHIPAGLARQRRLVSGIAALALCAGLLVSALFLYYAASESVREWSSLAHQALGVLATAIVFGHVALDERGRTADRAL